LEKKSCPISHTVPVTLDFLLALSSSSASSSQPHREKKGFKIGFGRPYCRQESDRSAARAP
jgi:hypothetical protein